MVLGSLDYVPAPCCFPVKKACSVALFKNKNKNKNNNNNKCIVNYQRHSKPSCISLSLAVAPTERRIEDSGHVQRITVRKNDDNNAIISSSVKVSSNTSAFKSKVSPVYGDPTSEATLEIDERERMRRDRIGLANKGKTPWNKGKHHSPETKARMRERNRIVMRDPKIRDKLRQYSHPQSQETREKLRTIMKARMEFERRQRTILQDWKDSIAESARFGIRGDDELQWDSYCILKEELRQQYIASKKKKLKEKLPRTWTFEQRLRISESVSAKWTDPKYREKVIARIHETRQKGQSVRRVKQKLADEEFDKVLAMLTSSSLDDIMGSASTKVGSFNDPLAEEKLKKIKMRRVQNVTGQSELSIDVGMAATDLDVRAQPNDSSFSGTHLEKIKLPLVRNAKQKQRLTDKTGSPRHGGSSVEAARIAELAALQKAQREATEKARLLLAEAERAAVLAAQALDAAGARDESLSNSLLEAWTLLDEANKSILGTEVESSFPS